MKEGDNILPYGYPLTVNFKNTSNFDFDDYSGERTRTYGVVTTFTTQKYTQKIQYEVTVTYIKQDINTKQWIVRLSKTQVFINQASTSRTIDKLNEAFMLDVLYPLEFIVSNTGKLIGIHNFEKLETRFKSFIIQKKKEYVGIFVERYLKLLAQKIKDAYTLQSVLQKDWFIASFFMPLYSPNGFLGDVENSSNYFPSCNPFDAPIYFQDTLKQPSTFVSPNTMKMYFDAKNMAKQTYLTVDYTLNTTNFLINNIRAKTELKNNNDIVKTITTTIQHLREKDTYIPKNENNMSLIQRINKWFDS